VTPQKIIIDCDPGIDDALALLLAHGHPGLELRGITTVAGNVALELTTANALAVREFARLGEVPVTPGCAGPLVRPPLRARDVHGDTGLGGTRLPAARGRAAAGHAVDYLIEATAAEPGEITLIATGPLTNIALALRREPRLAARAASFVIMGGSAGRGNTTPAAEFNMLADPEAAAVVFGAGWTVTMVGLDVTLQARFTGEVRDRISALGRLGTGLVIPALDYYRPGGEDPAVHDVCAVAYVARPDLFRLTPARVEVETAGRWATGMTVTDFTAAEPDRNALVATGIDVAGFWDLVIKAYERVAAGMA
jgi:purine nucleosidase